MTLADKLRADAAWLQNWRTTTRLADMSDRLSQAADLLDRLPRTADGVVIVPGMPVFLREHLNRRPVVAQLGVAWDVATSWGMCRPEMLFSTREAAEAARE